LPSPHVHTAEDRGIAEHEGAIRERLHRWRGAPAVPPRGDSDDVLIGGCAAAHRGFLAAVSDAGTIRLVVDHGDGLRTSAADIARALAVIDEHADTCAVAVLADAAPIVQRLERWLANQSGAASIDLVAAAAARSRRKALARVSQTLARAPRHQRAAFAPLADAARAIGTAALGEGAERVLDTLVAAPLDDEAWLRSLAAFSELNARPIARPRGDSRVIALIVFQSNA
jgi:hypothetical protein